MKLAIFDLDDTLINFAATRQAAYRGMADLLTRGGVDAPAFLAACPAVDRALFVLFETGQISRADYRLRRFSEPFDVIGAPHQPALVQRLNTFFMDCVNDTPLLFDDAKPVLQALRVAGIRTAILTNGPSDGQRRKLKATGLTDAVDEVVIGEEIGFRKPSPQAFHWVIDRFSLGRCDALMIGDSPELDHDAALSAGLGARLLDREGHHAGGAREVIQSLDDVRVQGLIPKIT